MATVTTKYSPLHIDCTVGQPYGNPSQSYTCGFHTGIDFPSSGAGGGNPDLYSCVEDGEVVYTHKSSTGHSGQALGNQVQIYDKKRNLYFRYCHMVYGSITLNVGDKVNLSTFIGKMGNTGNSSGTHLHLECSTTKAWQCSTFKNPGEPLGIPNVRGTVVKWDGTQPPIPPIPPIKIKRKKFPWVLLARKIRNHRGIY